MDIRFEFATATRIVFGPGSLQEAGAFAKSLGRRALVVTGRHTHRADPLFDNLSRHHIQEVAFPTAGEPEVSTVEKGVQIAKSERCDLVISFGGGSAIDAGKAIAAMMTNPGELHDYLEVIGQGKTLPNASAPFLAIPTTAGTGSEVTRNAVLASPAHQVKVSLRSHGMLARVALLDPELTYNMPPAITVSTGLDALTQVIEPYVSVRANLMTDGYCVEGMRRAARSLRLAVEDGQNVAARQDMALTSLFGGLSLANAGLGAVHGFAGPIGGMFDAPHGAICAALLPSVTRINLRALRARQPGCEALRRYDEVARLLTGKPAAAADDAVEWLNRLVTDLQVPRLSTYGITREHTPKLIAKAAQASSMRANPIVLTPEELAEALESAL